MAYNKEEKGADQTVKDPVCGMDVDEKHDSISHDGKKYYFCCASCKWAFEKDPQQFVSDK